MLGDEVSTLPEKDWHAQARELRALGVPYTRIAKQIGRDYRSVYVACNPEIHEAELARKRGITSAYKQRMKDAKTKKMIADLQEAIDVGMPLHEALVNTGWIRTR